MYVPEHAILGDNEFLETVVESLKANRAAAAAAG
jgi:hypothetical protein